MKRTACLVTAGAFLLAACPQDKPEQKPGDPTATAGGQGAGPGSEKPSAPTPPGAKTPTPTPAPPPTPRPSQGALPKLAQLALPEDPLRAEKIALGNALFFDNRLSFDGSRSCYTCHQNEDGTGGHDPIAIGAGNKPLTRHSPALVNVAYFKNSFYWDGRSPTLEAQAIAAWAGGNMGVGQDKLEKQAMKIGKIKGYAKMFKAAFPGQKVSADRVVEAIAEYERTFVCNDTAYDRFAAGDKTALSEEQQRGLDVFMTKGQCVACHAPPFFSSAMGIDGGVYFNVGMGTANKPEADVDVGRMAVTKNPADWAAFKPPTLRNIAKTAPYFHNGSVTTLEEAVHIMASGGIANKAKSPLVTDRQLTPDETKDLVAFLRGLDCGLTLVEPKLPK